MGSIFIECAPTSGRGVAFPVERLAAMGVKLWVVLGQLDEPGRADATRDQVALQGPDCRIVAEGISHRGRAAHPGGVKRQADGRVGVVRERLFAKDRRTM